MVCWNSQSIEGSACWNSRYTPQCIFQQPLMIEWCLPCQIHCPCLMHLSIASNHTFISWPVSKSVEKQGVGNCAISQHLVTLIRLGHGIKARTHSHCEITQFPNQQPSGPRNHSACHLVVPGPDGCLIGNYTIFQLVCVLGKILNKVDKLWLLLSPLAW